MTSTVFYTYSLLYLMSDIIIIIFFSIALDTNITGQHAFSAAAAYSFLADDANITNFIALAQSNLALATLCICDTCTLHVVVKISCGRSCVSSDMAVDK
jgi:hypothetical protein